MYNTTWNTETEIPYDCQNIPMANWNLLLSLDLQAVSFTQGVSSSSASLVSSSGPRDTSSTELEPDAASRFCLSLLAAVRGQGCMFNSVIVLYKLLYCNTRTDEGALLCTGSIIGANFHPTVEIYLKETSRIHVCWKVDVYLETHWCGCLTSSMLGWPVCGSTNAKVFTSNLLTWEWDVVFPWLSTGTELLMSSRGLGHLHRVERLRSAAWFASSACVLLRLTRHTAVSIQSVETQGRQSNPSHAGKALGLGMAERWRPPRMLPYAEARTVEAGLRARRM